MLLFWKQFSHDLPVNHFNIKLFLISSNVKSKKTENEQEKTSASSSISTSSRNTSLMWVDKYKPNNIKQIIGQQGASSNVQKLLNWLKKWKFNNCTAEGRARPKPKITPWGGGDPTGASFKAALLSGPPGVGKTTSATLVCQVIGLYFDLHLLVSIFY